MTNPEPLFDSRPYYDQDGITIYHGDCRDVLPTLNPVDLVLTDPPYGIGADYGTGYDDTPDNVRALAADVLPLCFDLSPVTLVTCGVPNVHLYPPPRWTLAWVIPAGTTTNPWGFSTWQPVLAYGSDPYLRLGMGRRADTIVRSTQGARVAVERDRFDHPCPKPLPAWKQILVRGSARESDVILDPFMGTGTTLLAARQLGRRAIGIEQSERYCEVAAERLAQGVLFGGEWVVVDV